MMNIINGGRIAAEIKTRLAEDNKKNRLQPGLAVILVGDQADSKIYVGLKEKAVAAVGGRFRLEVLGQDAGSAELMQLIGNLNEDPTVDGIVLQLPLPPALQAEQDKFLAAIDPDKDVDGFHPENRGRLMGGQPRFISCAALACLEIIERQFPALKGKRSLLAGNSFDLIMPLTLLLLQRGVLLEVIPSWQERPLEAYDLAVIEQGGAHMIGDLHSVRPILLIDAGFYTVEGRVLGNIDGPSLSQQQGWLLPVPGGLGPLLIAKLMENLSRGAGRRNTCRSS